MKRTAIALITMAIISCGEQPVESYAIFSGKIEKPNSKMLTVAGPQFMKNIVVYDNGGFADTLIIKAGYYQFNDGKEMSEFYLKPGYDLYLTLNAAEFDESIKYTGTGSAANNYLVEKFLLNEKEMGDFQAFYGLEEVEFMSRIAQFRSKEYELLDLYQGLDAEFTALEKRNIEYEYLSNLQNYPGYHSYVTKNPKYEPDVDFLLPLKEVDFDNEADYNNFTTYRGLVGSHYRTLMGRGNYKKAFEVIGTVKSNAIKNDLLRNLAREISPKNENIETLYVGLMDISSNQKFKSKITEKYNRVRNLTRGNVSPKFSFEDINGKKVVLDDLKGKYVYVDIWATWCQPCLREIPSLIALEKEYQHKEIVFVSISVDLKKDFETWKKMVKEKELRGIQLFADKDWASDFVMEYAVESIPRFILIDKEGNIVTADAPRPSDPGLKEDLFKKLKI